VRAATRSWGRAVAAGVATLLAGGALAAGPSAAAQEQQEWEPVRGYTSTDRGDGTYTVPLLNADVPDVAVELLPAAESPTGRDTWYMISTTMHLSPGAPIMRSYDLVNWEIVSYAFDRASIGDAFSLRNGQNSYGQGQWASSLRYHDGTWYVLFNTNNLGGAYLYRTTDIENGAWERTALGRGFHDPSLFFDEADGGTPYIFYGGVSAVRLDAGLTRVVQEYPNLIRQSDYPGAPYLGGLFEGAQVQYIDGWYYVVMITWPSGQGRQVVLFRSRELLGRFASADGSTTYEARGVLDSNGFAQGSLVPIPREDGTTDWHGMFFRDTFPTGRIPALIPATWSDGWPTFGTNGSVPVNGVFPKPVELTPAQERLERTHSLVVSDDFDNDAPSHAYQDEQWELPTPPAVDPSLLGVELVDNPGFEAATTAPWQGQFGAVLTRHPASAANGQASLAVGNRTLNGSGPAQRLQRTLQRGVTYRVQATVRYDAGPETIRFDVVADWGTGVQTMAAQVVPRGTWSTVSGLYTVPSDAAVDDVKLAVETPWGNPQPASSTVSYLLDDVSVVGQPVTTEHPHPDEVAPNGSRLDLRWQWNHAPDNRYWSLTEREGWLRLTNGKVVTGDYVHSKLGDRPGLTWLEETRNTLSQRVVGPRQSAEVRLDVARLADGDVAGLAAYGRGFSYVAVRQLDGVRTVGVVNRVQPFPVAVDRAATETFLPGTTAALGDATEVHLKADLELANPTGQLWTTFYYSLDGQTWTRLGNRVGPQTLDGSLAHFMGHRLGVFGYATQRTGGSVDVDHFLLSDVLTSQGLPVDRSRLDAAVSYAGGLDAAAHPEQAWQEMQRALAAARAAQDRPLGTQNQVDAPARALDVALARLGVLQQAAPSPAVDVTADTRCVAGRVVVTTVVANRDVVPVRARVRTDSGSRDLVVEPGRSAAHAASTRLAAVPAGTVTAEVSGVVDGREVTRTITADHAARTCG
jgi:beta-xylosidase